MKKLGKMESEIKYKMFHHYKVYETGCIVNSTTGKVMSMNKSGRSAMRIPDTYQHFYKVADLVYELFVGEIEPGTKVEFIDPNRIDKYHVSNLHLIVKQSRQCVSFEALCNKIGWDTKIIEYGDRHHCITSEGEVWSLLTNRQIKPQFIRNKMQVSLYDRTSKKRKEKRFVVNDLIETYFGREYV